MDKYVSIQDLIKKIKEYKHEIPKSYREESYNVGIDTVVVVLNAIERDERNYPQIKRKED